jgi:glucokinase
MSIALGIDIGGTNIRYALVSDDGACEEIETLTTKEFEKPEEFVTEMGRQLRNKGLGGKLKGIGIGAPNANGKKGTIDFAPNLPWKGIVPLASLFEKELKMPCALVNDANAAALGEMLYGKAKKINDFIFITLGTGLGSGIVVNRKLLNGHNQMAAELGHVIVSKNGRTCRCGRQGCLETYVSASGIKKTIEEWLRQGERSSLEKNSVIHSADIFEAAQNGDALAKKAFEFTGEILGLALANSVAYTDPQAIFISGGLSKAKELLFGPTRVHFENNLMNIYKNRIGIFSSAFEENRVAVLGAASLILQENII